MLKVSGSGYQLTGVNVFGDPAVEIQAFNDVLYAGRVGYARNLEEAVQVAAKVGAVLPSAQEDVLFRIAGNDVFCMDAQWSRTVALYFVENGKARVAFDDPSTKESNLAYAYCAQMARRQMRTIEFLLPESDTFVRNAVARARIAGRIADVPDKPQEYDMRGADRDRMCLDEVLRACYGCVLEQVVVGGWFRRLKNHKDGSARVETLSAAEVEYRCARGSVDVRLVRLGDVLGGTLEVSCVATARMPAGVSPVIRPGTFYQFKKKEKK